jgi:NAD(P)H dehydrogenase (quinone)
MILVTGATGQVGREVVRLLAGDVPVRALVRDRDAAGLDGAEISVGSFDDRASLARAMTGVETLFLAGRDNPAQVDQHSRVLAAAAAAGVGRVVKLSAAAAARGSPVALMRWHATTEQELRAAGVRWTFLRPHLYMQNLLRFAAEVAGSGTLTAPMGSGAFPLVDTRDVAAAAAAVLRDPGQHAMRTYVLTGPRAVSYAEIAAAMAAVAGRAVEYRAAEPAAFRERLLRTGIPEWRADDLAAIATAYADDDNRVSADLPAILGRPATSLERFLADHRDALVAGAAHSHA